MTSRNKSLHWFHLVAVEEIIFPPLNLSDSSSCSILSLAPEKFLPTLDDINCLREDFIVLFCRILTTHLKDFKYRSAAPKHIPHCYCAECQVKSKYVSLGILDLNEIK